MIEIKKFNNLSRKELYRLVKDTKTVNCWNYKTPGMIKKERNFNKYRDIFLNWLIHLIEILTIWWVILLFIWLIV